MKRPPRPAMAGRAGRALRGSRGMTMMELLVVIAISSVVVGALLMTWFALSRSYALTTSSSDARDFARDAVARLARELRDAEPDGVSPALRTVTSDEVVFTTTFNDPDNELAGSQPVLTRYWYEWDATSKTGSLHRQRDTDRDGKLFEDGSIDPGDRDMVVVRNLLNPRDQGHADIFRYSYIDVFGHPSRAQSSVPATSIATIFMVRVSLSVDLNPQSAPEPMHLSTTVQLRNQSRF